MDEVVRAIEDCLVDISTWLENNFLKLNQTKTELVVFSSKQSVEKTRNFRLKIGSIYMGSAKSVRNICIILEME